MDYSNKPIIIFIGNTGTGKSAVCNYFHKKLANQQDRQLPFQENDSVSSTKMQTSVPFSYQQINIVDTPGLQDSSGAKCDKENLQKIVQIAKDQFVNSTFSFVLNEKNPRFDESTQDTFCQFYKTFGPEFLKKVNFIFTRANSMKLGKEKTQDKVKAYTQILSERIKIPIQEFPAINCFQFECHPDQLEGFEENYKQELVARTEAEFMNFMKIVLKSKLNIDYSLKKPTVIIFVGNTGTGKSAVCNYFHFELSGRKTQQFPFKENDSASSTKMETPILQSHQQIKIIDTPGLQDSGGTKSDVENLRKILGAVEFLKIVNVFSFVLNEQNPRFDESTQATFCLFYTTFGPEFLKHVNFIFTRANSLKLGKEKIQEKVKTYTQILSERLNIPIQAFPKFNCFQFECHPEQLEGCNQDYKQKLISRTETEFREFMKVAQLSKPLDTTSKVQKPKIMDDVFKDEEKLKKSELKLKQLNDQIRIAEAQMSNLQNLNIEKQQAKLQLLQTQQRLEKYNKNQIHLTQTELTTTNKQIQEFTDKITSLKSKNLKGSIEKVKAEIKELQLKIEQANQEQKQEKEKVSRWWWLLASPVLVPLAAIAAPVGLGVAASAATFAATATVIATICKVSEVLEQDQKQHKE